MRSIIVASSIILFLTACMIALSFTVTRPLNVQIVPAQAKIADVVGFNLDTDQLYFGTINRNGVSKRSLSVTYSKDSFVVISAQGQMASWMSASEDAFFLPANTRKNIEFSLRPSLDSAFGNYTANVSVSFYRPIAQYLLSP